MDTLEDYPSLWPWPEFDKSSSSDESIIDGSTYSDSSSNSLDPSDLSWYESYFTDDIGPEEAMEFGGFNVTFDVVRPQEIVQDEEVVPGTEMDVDGSDEEMEVDGIHDTLSFNPQLASTVLDLSQALASVGNNVTFSTNSNVIIAANVDDTFLLQNNTICDGSSITHYDTSASLQADATTYHTAVSENLLIDDSFADVTECSWEDPPEHLQVEESLVNITISANITLGDVQATLKLLMGGTNKGAPKLCLLPYCHSYRLDHPTKNGRYQTWRCCTHKCLGRIWTNSNFEETLNPAKIRKDHDDFCKPTVSDYHINNFVTECKKMCIQIENLFKPVQEIIDYQRERCLPRGIPNEHVPNNKQLGERLNYTRRSLRAPAPKKNDLLGFDLKQHALAEDFFVEDIVVGPPSDKRRHFLFQTPHQRDLMRNCKELRIDGTFKIVPKPHKQLVTVHGNICTPGQPPRSVPLFYILMSGKRQIDYEAVFEVMKTEIETGGPMQVQSFMMDYELAIWNAVRKVFGQVRTRGCWFHYCQAIMKKVQELKLINDYYLKQDVYKMVRRLMTLALIDEPNICKLFGQFKSRYQSHIDNTDAVKKLFAYMEKQWILNSIITPLNWNCFEESVRTNNQIESWNGGLWKKAGYRSHHIYLLSFLLKKEAIRQLDSLDYPASNYTKPHQARSQKAIDKIYHTYRTAEPRPNPRVICDQLMAATRKVVSWTRVEAIRLADIPDDE